MTAPDDLYESALPILQSNDEEEDKTDKIEGLVRKATGSTGKLLETTVLDILWRYRNSTASASGTPGAVRHTVVRRNSPAPWQEKASASRTGTPATGSPRSSSASPAPPPGLPRPALYRMKSSQQSPFGSPRNSPRLAQASLLTPHSPSFVSREPSTAGTEYDGSDPMDWPNSVDDMSRASSGMLGDWPQEYASAPMMDMTPYDILRSVLRDQKSDEDIENILEANAYDLSAALMSLMSAGNEDAVPTGMPSEPEKTYLIGKSMASSGLRPSTPSNNVKSNVVCRYWLATGNCLRADCRFSHDMSNHICKYWLQGNCLAGDSCIFSHDPAALMGNMSLNDPAVATPPIDPFGGIQANDYNSFPSLSSQPSSSDIAPPPGFSSRPPTALAPEFFPSRPQSRPTSRHHSPSRKSFESGADEEAFPTLGAAAVKGPKKHHGKRGHGHHNRDRENQTLANVVRQSPSPNTSTTGSPRRNFKSRTSFADSRENSTAAQAIPAPQHIPWLETGDRANKDYLKARQEAIKHGGARNKFLQSAAQAWNRNDVRAAKALSLRGQDENDRMREAHREAAEALYRQRNSSNNVEDETYVDLHGLHPVEGVRYLDTAMREQRSTSALHRERSNILYAIVGTGHHSKGGRDKVGRAVRNYLNDSHYVFREFSVPGDRGGNGGILGIDCASSSPSNVKVIGEEGNGNSGAALQQGKIRILKAEEAREAGF